MKTLRYIILGILISAFTSGCIKEKLTHCTPGVYITYYYDHNKQYTNLFQEQVDRLEVFVFDNNNIFYQKFVFTNTKQLTNNHKINIPIPQGNWTIVTWCGDMVDYTTDPLIPGQTPLDQFNLFLKPDKVVSENEIEITHPITQLYHGEVTNITTYDDKYTYANIELRKNISAINLKIAGLSLINPITKGLGINDFNIKTILNNDSQTPTNAIALNSKNVTYKSTSIIDADTLKTSHNVMRLLTTDKSGQIIIESPSLPNGNITIPLMETILKNPAYKTQDDLDREDTYNFLIQLEPTQDDKKLIKITITINSWKIIYITPGVE